MFDNIRSLAILGRRADGGFLRGGDPHRILSGSLHYVRVRPDQVMPHLVSRQAANGGPIVAVQVENEYGSYGVDVVHMAWLREGLLARGVAELLYTAGGPTELIFDGAPCARPSGCRGDHKQDAGGRRVGEPVHGPWRHQLRAHLRGENRRRPVPADHRQLRLGMPPWPSTGPWSRSSTTCARPCSGPVTSRSPLASAHPLAFEELGADAGLVFYSARPILPKDPTTISILELRDRADSHAKGTGDGVLERNDPDAVIGLTRHGERVELEIVVECQRRIITGPRLGESKGILGGVLIGRRLVSRWSHRHVALDNPRPAELLAIARTTFEESAHLRRTGLAEANPEVAEPADAFVSPPGSVKGPSGSTGFSSIATGTAAPGPRSTCRHPCWSLGRTRW